MSLADYLLLALVGGYCLHVLLHPKKKKCGGSCAHCSGCK